MLIEVQCGQCQKTFMKERKDFNSNLKKGYKNYCSKECETLGKQKQIYFTCDNCGVECSCSQSSYNKSKSGLHFCSQSCAATVNNSLCRKNYKNGMSTYRERALEYYPNECSVCGYNIVEVLEIHHKDCNRTNNDLENLDILCPTHHTEYQIGIRKY